jgi:transcriptional regulator GlxA family with amidase domain
MARAQPESRQQLKVGFILLDDFTLNAFSGFVDALRLAADEGGRSRQIRCAWRIMGPKPVTASCGLSVTPSDTLTDPARFDYVAVCGGNGYLVRRQPAWLDRYLRQADASGVPLVGVCTGTFNIARAGLMRGHVACVHWNVVEAFRDEFPDVPTSTDRIFVDTGSRITCAGSAGAADLGLHLIARHCGPERAQQSLRHMMIPAIRPAEFPQAHFHCDLSGVRDAAVKRAVLIMEQTLNRPLRLGEIATAVGLSLRHLQRRFAEEFGVTPGRFARDLRLKYATWLLERTDTSIADIAAACGFADAPHFARHFGRQFQSSPSTYRRSRSHAQSAT